MKRQNKNQKEKELVNRINSILLNQEINSDEMSILNHALQDLKKSAYLPGVVNGLRNSLTPLAINGTLSKDVADFYKELNSPKFMNKNLGGMISVWSNIFG